MKIGNSSVLPVMGVLTVVSAAVGLQLGESAIAQIDPIHFQGARPELRDVSRERRYVSEPSYASAYGWAESEAALDAECGDCRSRNTRLAVAATWEPVQVDQNPPGWADATEYSRTPDEVRMERDIAEWREMADRDRVGRYVHYPVTGDEEAEILVVDREPLDQAEPAGL